MPLYLSSEALGTAVARLGESRARPGLCDFLVLKFAMALGDGSVILSLRDEVYMQAVHRLALALPESEQSGTPEPYFNPFGASRETKRGWRTAKYPSNGPPDTVNGPNWSSVIDVLSHGPRRVQFTSDYVDHLAAIVVTSEGPFPRTVDTAAWFFRFEDLEPIVGPDHSDETLVHAFESAVKLTAGERKVIFGED